MNSLLICMTMCANCALAIYFILKKIFKVYLVPEIRYILLLIVMALYLFPFPLLKYDFINLLRGVFEEERVVSVLENRVEQYINLNKIILIKKDKVLFLRYDLIIMLLLGIWLIILLCFSINILMRYLRLRKYVKNMEIINVEESDFDSKWLNQVKKRKLTIGKMKDLKCAFTYGVISPVVVLPNNLCEKDENRIHFINEHYPEVMTVSPEACADFVLANSDHGGADVVLEVAGAESTFRLSWECARPNAIVTIVALYEKAQLLPLPDMYGKNLTFKTGGVDGCDCKETLRLIAEGKIDTEPLITHTYPLSKIAEAYDLFENKKDGVIKVAVEC